MVDQGLSFTVVEAPHPLEGTPRDPDAGRDFKSAYRVWLGANAGTDWLHDAIEQDLGEDALSYEVQSRRDAAHVGASGEVATVVLFLLGVGALDLARKFYAGFAQRIGEASADVLLEWARQRSREHRAAKGLEDADGPPDFLDRATGDLAAGMTGELASLAGVPESSLELVEAHRSEPVAMRAVYRDRRTGDEYEVVASSDSATFTSRRCV